LSASASTLNLPGNYLAANRIELLDLVRQSGGFELFYRDELLLVGFTDQVDTKARLSARSKDHRLGMVVVHLPYREVLDTASPPSVRTVLTGGSDFELRQEGGYGGNYSYPQSTLNPTVNPSAQRSYQLQANSRLVIGCTVSGNIRGQSHLLLHLRGWDAKQQQLSDMRNYLRLEYLSGNQWVRLSQTEPGSVLVPLSGTEELRRHPQLRITAISEFTLEMPDAEI
ncbi:MAG: hypothetical protein M3R04_02630, partial [bacterium]|nr:hypothetical protein [bacterium]